LRASR